MLYFLPLSELRGLLRYTCPFLVVFFLSFSQLLTASAAHGSFLQSGYWHERDSHERDNNCDTSSKETSLDHLQYNSRYLIDPSSKNKGLCLGMACAYLQATLAKPDLRNLLGKRLKTCSQHHDPRLNSFEKAGEQG